MAYTITCDLGLSFRPCSHVAPKILVPSTYLYVNVWRATDFRSDGAHWTLSYAEQKWSNVQQCTAADYHKPGMQVCFAFVRFVDIVIATIALFTCCSRSLRNIHNTEYTSPNPKYRPTGQTDKTPREPRVWFLPGPLRLTSRLLDLGSKCHATAPRLGGTNTWIVVLRASSYFLMLFPVQTEPQQDPKCNKCLL